MSFSVSLTRDGIRHEISNPLSDDADRVVIHRPATVAGLLRFWHYDLDSIAPDYTLGDLLALLAGVRNIGSLSGLFSCDVAGFLAEAALPATDPATDIDYLEVYNCADLDGYDPDARGPGARHFTPPYCISRGFHGWGAWDEVLDSEGTPTRGGIAVEFTPVYNLVHLPLRYNPDVDFEADRYGPPAFSTSITITFGEFVHAVLWEVGFFGTPGDRNENRGALEAACDDVEIGLLTGDLSDFTPLNEMLDLLGDVDDAEEDEVGGAAPTR